MPGLKAGDKIASIDGLQIHSVPALLAYLQDQKGKPAVLSVLRNGQTLVLNGDAGAYSDDGGTKAYILGFQAGRAADQGGAAFLSRRRSRPRGAFNKKNSLLIRDVLKGMFERRISVKQLSGPIGIGQIVHEAAEAPGWMPLIGTMAMISINLGMLNLLPFPVLDGGMIFFLLIESIFRRDVPMPIKERIYQVAFVCVALFFVFVIFNDITKLPVLHEKVLGVNR